ncbi:MAG: hypothetical protein ACKO8U_09130, partial [Pirellula sp.]
IFPELRSILDEAFEIFGDKSEYVVAAPQYRAAAQGSRHTPLCRSEIKSVTHRSLADGTAECACYYASQQTNRTAARVPITRGLLLAWQFATHRTAELPAGH